MGSNDHPIKTNTIMCEEMALKSVFVIVHRVCVVNTDLPELVVLVFML